MRLPVYQRVAGWCKATGSDVVSTFVYLALLLQQSQGSPWLGNELAVHTVTVQ